MFGFDKKVTKSSTVGGSVVQSNGYGSVRVDGNVRGGVTIVNRRVWLGGVEYKPGDPQPEGVTITWS